MREFLALNRIRWRFIAQISPWAGGFYERLVKLCKDCFKRTLGRRILAFDDLNTLVAEVEATLNHRPITTVSDIEDGPMPLRPVNFIHPEIRVVWDTTSEWIDDPKSSHGRLAARIQALREANDSFWEKWQKDYLLLLRERSGWDHKGPRLQTHQEPKEGMVVLISEDLTPRNQWPIGRIIQLHGRPGAIRSVTVEIPVSGSEKRRSRDLPRKTTVIRPVNRIYPLEAGPEITEIPSGVSKTPPKALDPHLEQEAPEDDPPETNPAPLPRRSSRKIGTSHALLLLCIFFMGLFSSSNSGVPRQRRYPVGKCEECSLECTNKGVSLTVPPDIHSFELCCEETCTKQQGILSFLLELPNTTLLKPHECVGFFWTESRVFSENLSCPALEECDLIDCIFFLNQITEPNCHLTTKLFMAGGFLLTIILLALGYSVLRCLFVGLRMISAVFIPFTRRRASIQWEGRPDQWHEMLQINRQLRPRGSTNWTIRQLGPTVILVLSTLPTAQTEIQTIAVMSRVENCVETTSDLMCTAEGTATLTLLPAGQTNTLLLRTEDGRPMGSVQVTLRTLTLECQDYTKAWMRSYYIATTASKRCPSAGSCKDNYCEKVRSNSTIHELREFSSYPGSSFCMDSPASWGNQCFFGNPSHGACLFYRWFAKPRSSKVYELIGCNTWEFGVYAFFQMESAMGKTSSIETILHPGQTMKSNNASFSLIGISHPPAPLLNADFLFDGKKMAILREPLPAGLHCPDLHAAETFNCTLAPDSCAECFPNHQEGNIACECRSHGSATYRSGSLFSCPNPHRLQTFQGGDPNPKIRLYHHPD